MPGSFKNLIAALVTLREAAFEQFLTLQVDQRLDEFSKIDHPGRKRGAGDLDPDSLEHTLLAIERQSIDVLRDGDDFRCGDTFVFTFDHSLVLVDFDVSVSVQGN